jgi:hypothetical protein
MSDQFICKSALDCTITDCPHREPHEYDISCNFGRCEMAAGNAQCVEVAEECEGATK